ncbi:hypothetical protein CC86DRAFT_399808 [Ophiobolus disseminans]|uniref:Uncharacterized protein n=1 Tax=Ophiobolus disseminans TaxID=1469910 RepID=A0A6A7AIM5_9PLEO|nr:hypothetical protein CC86DRAFT_399808 [Ophiobolus disseminans]
MNLALKSCLYNAIHSNKRKNKIQPQYLCPTGNCTWDRFATFAFCPRCVDVSKHLKYTCKDQIAGRQYCNVSFPGGSPSIAFDAAKDSYFSGMVDSYFRVQKAESSVALNTTGCMRDLYLSPDSPQIWHTIRADIDLDVLGNLDGNRKMHNDTPIIGNECAMYPCVLSVDASVKTGEYQEDIIDTYYFPNEAGNRMFKTVVTPPWGKEKGVKSGDTFGMTVEAYQSAAATLKDVLIGEAQEADAGSGMSFTDDEIQAVFSAKYTNKTCNTPRDNFACAF